MAPSFQDSGRYASSHSSTNGPGDARPTAQQIIQENDLVGKLKDKTILITGGSGGIGIEEVRSLASTGATVVFTARDVQKGERVKASILEHWQEQSVQPQIEILKMDLQSLESVREAAEEFLRNHFQLHILINNAGIGLTPYKLVSRRSIRLSSLFDDVSIDALTANQTFDGFEQQFGVNHLAHFYLFQLLKSTLLKSTSPSFKSRVIAVASSIHTMGSVKLDDYNFEKGYDPFAAYASSKTANIWMSNELERRYADQGLHSISVHPGGFESGFQSSHDEEAGKMVAASTYTIDQRC